MNLPTSNKICRRLIISTATAGLLAIFGFSLIEPTLTRGADVGVSQTVSAEINLACDANVAGLSAIAGISGGTSNGTFNCTTTTNNSAGYNLTFKKNGLLLTAGGGADKQFDDYTGATGDPIDYNFAAPGAGVEYWGFNMTAGTDVATRFKDNGAACNVAGAVNAGQCWVRVPTTPTVETVATGATATGGSGVQSSFGVRMQAGASNALQSGTYTSTLVVTATML